ncbi:redoxin domain-containing protein [Sphaerisporangium sp. B11E5]|uniref:redoxin domain-containing protein n=1 Tax=Sphaerisporangium sp. B11E5 TaxID=3153563 RepID=UPI00325D3271
MKARLLVTGLVTAAALALAGCGAPAGDPGPAPASGGTPAATSTGGYDFTVATLDGGTFDGRALAGRPAVLWFWAPWCPTCLGQAKQVNALAAEYEGKAAVVGVAGLGDVPEMREFVRMAKLSGFPQLADEQGLVWKQFGMTAQSTFVVLDADGAVAARGHLDAGELPDTLDRLLAG